MYPWEGYLFQYEQYLGDAVKHWRDNRDANAKRQKIILRRVYQQGDFLSLPKKVLMAVCYVDAYQCALGALHEHRKAWLEAERIRLEAEREYNRTANRIKRLLKRMVAWIPRPKGEEVIESGDKEDKSGVGS